MKRILLGALTLVVSLTAARPAQAWRTFGLIVCPNCCRCSSCEFRVRQYNAFSPVCSGCITCDGVMPFASMAGPGYGGMGYGPGMCCDGFPVGTAPATTGPGTSGTQASPLPPAPALMPAGQGAMNPYWPGYSVQPVGYYPGYSPAVPMTNYWNPMGQMPYYWSPMGGR